MKRKKPKNWIEKDLKNIVNAINNINNRLNNLEFLFHEFIKWKRYDKKFQKHIDKKLKDSAPVQDKQK